VLSLLTRVLGLASVVICLIAIASFGLFAFNQTSSASTHQQEVLNGEAHRGAAPRIAGSAKATPPPESSLHQAIDDASNALASPFAGVTAGSSSQWVIRSAKLLLALAVYGFGLGFLVRVIRVRV
jgi:hypothetical protein